MGPTFQDSAGYGCWHCHCYCNQCRCYWHCHRHTSTRKHLGSGRNSSQSGMFVWVFCVCVYLLYLFVCLPAYSMLSSAASALQQLLWWHSQLHTSRAEVFFAIYLLEFIVKNAWWGVNNYFCHLEERYCVVLTFWAARMQMFLAIWCGVALRL